MFRTAVRISLSVRQTDGHGESTGKSLGNEKGGILMFFEPRIVIYRISRPIRRIMIFFFR